MPMTTFQTIYLMISFATLIVAILSFHKREK
ncbi:putative holin-like toxin [Lederbergia wuyishanensis]